MNMPNNKLITVCIATYNRSEIVTQLVKGLLAFELNDQIEILIIDDCSPDNTFESLSQFSNEPNVSIFRNPENLSRARTQLKYFNLCKTEFLIELPDDDILYKEGLLELIQLLPSLDVDFLSTRWIDSSGLLYPDRGSKKVQEITLTNLRVQSEHSIGCVFRASIIKYSETYLLERLDKECALAFFFHQDIVLCMAMLNDLRLLSCPILLGGFRPEGPVDSNFVDVNGNSYFSLPATFNKYMGMKEFYEDMLKQFPDSPLFNELSALSKAHNLSLYGAIDDSFYISDEFGGTTGLSKNFRSGSMRNIFKPFKSLRYFFWFLRVKIGSMRYR
jgi:glycosyltransferase involved in cell wall biosynthesis